MIRITLLICFVLALNESASSQQPPKAISPTISIDGVFDDWNESDIAVRDPAGDANGTFDITNVFARLVDSRLFLSIELTEPLNLQNGDDLDGSLLFFVRDDKGVGWNNTEGLLIDFRKRKAIKNGSEGEQAISWKELKFECLPTYAAKRFEFSLDLDCIHNEDSNAKAVFGFQNSDTTDVVTIEAVHRQNDARQLKLQVLGEREFRIANLNTLRNGLADPKRGPKIKRLVDAVDASVYCFQEEWDEGKFRLGLTKAFDANVNSLWAGGCAIITKFEMESIPMTLDRAVAGVVTLNDEKRVAFISAHFKCCGYAGSNEDNLRVQQAEQLVGEIKRLRNGDFGEELKEVPIVLIGDYNLVGSRTPLDIINKAGLNDLLMKFPGDGSAYTWRGLKPDEEFWPGRLDLLSYSEGLKPLKGWILDTERLAEKQLGDFKQDDSRASDHLMLIGDFEVR